MKLFENILKKEENNVNFFNTNFNTNILESEERNLGSKLGLELSNMVRTDEEYAKFNKYMK